ncbi:MAG: ribosome biogenesis GTPase Der [Rickettsiales bacterium]
MSFTIALIGRPNVGKSTLFNRLTGKRQALVDDMPGVTRDRRMGAGNLGGVEFTLLDTAGLETAETGTLQARMTAQTEKAVDESDAVIMMIDGRAGVLPVDEYFAGWLRKQHKPVILVVNKAEGNKAGASIAEAHKLGFGEPIGISAEHGEGMGDLFDVIAPLAKEQEQHEVEENENTPLQLAIIGRPNVGKSTLLNKILGEERVLTGPEAGITRDSIMVNYMFEGRPLKLVDTAGMRRKANVNEKVEKLAVADSIDSLQYAHVVVLVIDANQPLEKQDNTIAALVEQEGRAMVIAVNKWDTVDDKPAYLKAINQRLTKVLPQVKGIPVVPISAETGFQIPKLLRECFKIYDLWNTKITTAKLNRWLEYALEKHTPQLVSKRRLKIRYITQKTARPPTFFLFANMSEVPEHYLRYLANDMRESFDLWGVPIRIRVKKNKNPYVEKDT